MLAKIIFNLSFYGAILMGLIAAFKWGLGYFLPAAFAVFFVGMLAAFVVGMIAGAYEGME